MVENGERKSGRKGIDGLCVVTKIIVESSAKFLYR